MTTTNDESLTITLPNGATIELQAASLLNLADVAFVQLDDCDDDEIDAYGLSLDERDLARHTALVLLSSLR